MTKEELKAEYTAHRSAGASFHDEVRSELVLDVMSSSMTLDAVLEAERQLDGVSRRLNEGSWKTALLELNKIITNVILTQARVNSIRTRIEQYITTSYSW